MDRESQPLERHDRAPQPEIQPALAVMLASRTARGNLQREVQKRAPQSAKKPDRRQDAELRTPALRKRITETLRPYLDKENYFDRQATLVIVIDIKKQRLYLYDRAANNVVRSYPVSTGAQGTGTVLDSFKTPTGGFVVTRILGQNTPKGTVFFRKAAVKKANGQPATLTSEQLHNQELPAAVKKQVENHAAVMTSRLLELDGKDPRNANTLERGIMIHGTNREAALLSDTVPESDGCIRMLNNDVIALANLLQGQHQAKHLTPVVIAETTDASPPRTKDPRAPQRKPKRP